MHISHKAFLSFEMSAAAYLGFSCPPLRVAKVTHWLGIFASWHGTCPILTRPRAIGSTRRCVLSVHSPGLPPPPRVRPLQCGSCGVYLHEACPPQHGLKSSGQNIPFPLTSGVEWAGAPTRPVSLPWGFAAIPGGSSALAWGSGWKRVSAGPHLPSCPTQRKSQETEDEATVPALFICQVCN